MDDRVEIRLGPFAALRWTGWALLFSAVGLGFMVPDPSTETHEPIAAGLGWFLVACGLLFAALAIRSYRWLRAGKVMLTLTPEGLRGRPTQDVLVPWNQVKAVRRTTRRPSTFALGTQSFWLSFLVSTTDPFRYDAYEVKLDPELAKQGVKGEHALDIGFDVVPALMSFSSAQVAQAFAHWLPAERCLDFDNRADPLSTGEFTDRLTETAAVAALKLDDLIAAPTATAPNEPAATDAEEGSRPEQDSNDDAGDSDSGDSDSSGSDD